MKIIFKKAFAARSYKARQQVGRGGSKILALAKAARPVCAPCGQAGIFCAITASHLGRLP